MARKKILWLCSWYPGITEPFNGDFIQRHARAAALYNDIYVIHVIGDSTGQIQQTRKEIHKSEGLTEHLVYFKTSTSLIGRLKANFMWYFLVKQAIRKYMIDNKRPVLTHVHIPYKAALAGNWMRKKYKVPYVLSEHWGIYNDVEVLNYKGRTSLFKKVIRRSFMHAAACMSVSRFLADGVNRLVTPTTFSIIPNATDSRLFYYRQRTTDRFRFIHVSNMVPLKNVPGILRAFKLLLDNGMNAELLLVGNPDGSLPQLANAMGLTGSNVQFTGEIAYEAVAKKMQESDCLLLYSNIENSPCVIGEALCCGLPVIATSVGGIPELVDNSNALLTEPGNDEAFFLKMKQMVNDYAQYDRQSIAANAKARFSYETVGKQMDDVYESVIQGS